jgi:ankyrin repeat protein
MRTIVEGGYVDLRICRTEIGLTPLFFAASESSMPLVIYLVESGADVNAHMTDGVSLLTWEAKGMSAQTRAYLVGKGAR